MTVTSNGFNALPDWQIIKGFYEKSLVVNSINLFSNIELLSWKSFDGFYEALLNLSLQEKNEYLFLVEKSNSILSKFDGDPLNYPWENDFRPLRLSREEDWSDWLAFLIKTSNSNFINNLFGFKKKAANVLREYVADDARADVVIEWDTVNSATHIEVKIGDPNLGKTHDTSINIRMQMNNIDCWDDYILLLDNQVNDWLSADKANADKKINIKSITWTDVAVALRSSLYDGSENLMWQSFAYAFTGCIETKLYNAVSIDKVNKNKFIFNLFDQLNILRRSLKNG